MHASRYASHTPAENFAASHVARVKQDKEKAARLLNRLRWKAESLTSSHTRASQIVHAEIDTDGLNGWSAETMYPFVHGMTSIQVESMFKIDFFEFYTLLERYLELCLSILGISISGSGKVPRTNVNALRFITNPEFARSRPEQSSHRFHANLLDALDDASNPLHPALGSQDFRIQIGLAKDYRNRWKDADEKLDPSYSKWRSEDEGRRPIKLDSLDLQQMLSTILTGCEHALHIVHGPAHNLSNGNRSLGDRSLDNHNFDGYNTMEIDIPVEYMDDAMDLDDESL